MGFYDIIGEMTEKQMMKTDTGDNRIFGVVVGRVAKNYDKDMPGRVCVTVPTRDEEANELKWARVAMPYSGSKWGYYFLPEVGDQVLLVFEHGNIEKPYVIGCIPKDSNEILQKSADKDNQYKKIVTKNGNTIYMEDNKEGKGKKDKIYIQTSQDGHKIQLDNEKNVIRISDKNEKNTIEMETEKGRMEIRAQEKLTVKVGDRIELIMNGNDGSVQLKASSVKVEASGRMTMTANSAMNFEASNVSVKANATLKLNSSGAAILEGTTVKIG